MTPAALAALHDAAFPDARGWTTEEFSDLLASPHVFLVDCDDGFAIGRAVADEAELLTIAVAPTARRQGLGRILLARFEAAAEARGARRVFLEVAADNSPAQALYESAGYVRIGTRPAYYTRPGANPVAAVVMGKPLP
ncbi:ribosomal protein S18-alanine N-acetyltransferase [Thiosulfatihalobacter marinus]|uniref:ribosomal protein S18-alanine N-acetyltransferase n=1 Tax=Thiosulfatihalobacter marinus TaxID=2792481 RepID=UPI0018D7166B|nr:ribosomal protein S18-alanine N-acetyltransferase [Thiosulfatihalobacter marinus]